MRHIYHLSCIGRSKMRKMQCCWLAAFISTNLELDIPLYFYPIFEVECLTYPFPCTSSENGHTFSWFLFCRRVFTSRNIFCIYYGLCIYFDTYLCFVSLSLAIPLVKMLIYIFKGSNINWHCLPWCRFDGFTSTFQDKLFKGYNMEIHNQIFYTTVCSCVLSLTGRYPSLFSVASCLRRFF